MPVFISNFPPETDQQLPRDTTTSDESVHGVAVARQKAIRIWERETPWPWELNTCPSGLDLDYWTSDGSVVLPRKPNSSDVTTNTGSDMGIRDESSLESQQSQTSKKSHASQKSTPSETPKARPDMANADMEALFLISFTRCPSEFRLGLVEGPLLRECRQDMAAAGYSCELATGAKIFCEPEYYAAISRAVKDLEPTLRPYHVIVTEKFRQLLLQTAKACPRSMKVKVKEDRVIACFGKGQWIPFAWSAEKTPSTREQPPQLAVPSAYPPHMPTQFAAPPLVPRDPASVSAQPGFETAVLEELQRALMQNPFGLDLPPFDPSSHAGPPFDPSQASFPAWVQNPTRRPGPF
jgi:hypothetical protein